MGTTRKCAGLATATAARGGGLRHARAVAIKEIS
jgi:hypothetical protein